MNSILIIAPYSDSPSYGAPGIAGTLFFLDENMKQGGKYVQELSLPVKRHSDDEPYRLELLKPGNYMLRLYLLDGDTLDTEFQYDGEQGKPLEIVLPCSGKRESLYWHTQHKNVGSANFVEHERLSGRRHDSANIRLQLAIIAKPELTHPSQYHVMSERISNDSDSLLSPAYGTALGLSEKGRVRRRRRILELTPDEIIDNQLLFVLPVNSHYFQHYVKRRDAHFLAVIISSEFGQQWIRVPYPWEYHFHHIPVEILVSPNQSGINLNIAMQHPTINAALGYLRQGAGSHANGLFKNQDFEEMLYAKVSSPMTAALGGYLLFQNFSREKYLAEHPKWYQWIINLANWFEWLPDGAILQAALFTHFKLGNKDEAYEAAIRAYYRGMPFFSFGIELLSDVMHYFANEERQEAIQALPHLETVAAQTDFECGFTNVLLQSKYKAKTHSQGISHD